VFEFQAPARAGTYAMGLSLLPLDAPVAAAGTRFHSGAIVIDGEGPRSNGGGLPTAVTGENEAPVVYGVSYLEHSIPDRLNAGVTYGARLTVENTGTLTWPANPPDGDRVEVHVVADGAPLAVLPLPHGDVGPGARVTLHFAFRADDIAGPHRVRLELVHRGVRTFADAGVAPCAFDVTVMPVPWTETVRLTELQRKHNPWHYNPFAGISESRDGRPFPLFIARGKGCRVWDVEGHEFLDYTMGWGSTILGHADDRVQDAIRQALDTGPILPSPHPLEMEVSRMLVEDFPANDMVAFGKNGSDVCTIAARLARVVTGKRTILSSGFHGWQDFGLEYFAFEDCGIPFRDERCLHKFASNDRAGFLALYERHEDDLAAVMIEPAGAFLSDEAGLAGEADHEFLHTVADAARRANALLVFDEIKTGFRYRQGSAQKAAGIVPDLTCLGKALASGMPLSALAGPYRHFLEFFHKTHFCPTFRGEVYSLAAARAAIEIYRAEPVADHIWTHGQALGRGIREAARQAGIDGDCTGAPFQLLFVFREPDPVRRRWKRTLLMQELLRQGLFTVSGMMLPSYAHDGEALERALAAYGQAFEVIAHADRSGELPRYIDLPLL